MLSLKWSKYMITRNAYGIQPKLCAYFCTSLLTPLQVLHQRMNNNGDLELNDEQINACKILDNIHNELKTYKQLNDINEYDNIIEPLMLQSKQLTKPSTLNIPNSVYLYGNVGNGKTMLLDIFYETAPVPNDKKCRIHFQQFIAGVHDTLNNWKMNYKSGLMVSDDQLNNARIDYNNNNNNNNNNKSNKSDRSQYEVRYNKMKISNNDDRDDIELYRGPGMNSIY